MENRKHKLTYIYPGGMLSVEAENFSELESILSEKISGMLRMSFSENGLTLKEAAIKAQRYYNARRWANCSRPNQTAVERYGVEIDAIQCYLSGMKIKETVKYFEMEQSVFLSKSAVGRLFRRLFEYKIYPLKKGHSKQ